METAEIKEKYSLFILLYIVSKTILNVYSVCRGKRHFFMDSRLLLSGMTKKNVFISYRFPPNCSAGMTKKQKAIKKIWRRVYQQTSPPYFFGIVLRFCKLCFLCYTLCYFYHIHFFGFAIYYR